MRRRKGRKGGKERREETEGKEMQKESEVERRGGRDRGAVGVDE